MRVIIKFTLTQVRMYPSPAALEKGEPSTVRRGKGDRGVMEETEEGEGRVRGLTDGERSKFSRTERRSCGGRMGEERGKDKAKGGSREEEEEGAGGRCDWSLSLAAGQG